MSFLEKKKPDGRTVAWISLGLAVVFVLTIAIMLRQILTPVIIALVIAYIADPLLRRLERHRIRRGTATTLLYVSALVLLAITGILLGPNLWRQTQSLYQNVSGLAENYGGSVLDSARENGGGPPQANGDGGADDFTSAEDESAPASVPASGRARDTPEPRRPSSPTKGASENGSDTVQNVIDKRLPEWGGRAKEYLRDHADEIASRVAGITVAVARNAAKGLSSAAHFLFGLVLVLVFTFFFMMHFHKMVESVDRYIPAAYREGTRRIIRRVDSAMSDFFRGRLLVCFIAGVVYIIGLRVSGIDFWLLIGLVGGALSFIPILGVILPLIPACAFALLTGHPWASLLGVFITFSAVQWVVEPVVGTLILSRQVKMHPITILLALLIGGSLLGVFGLILSVPLAAVVRILGEEFLLPQLRKLAGHETGLRRNDSP